MIAPTLINSHFLTYLDWFCARTIERLLAEVGEHEGIGVPDRTWERRPELDLVIALRILSECSGRETSLVPDV